MGLIFLLSSCSSNLLLLRFDLGAESMHPVVFNDWLNRSGALQSLQPGK